MKKLGLLALLMIFALSQLQAQAPNTFKYQAVVRNSAGEIIGNKLISIKISILQNSALGTAVYSEVFNYTTNEYGVVAVNVGTGDPVLGVFNLINWGASSYYLQIEIDINGGSDYKFLGASQILSVPYALYALDVKNNNDADADPSNEIQDLQLNEVTNVLTITKKTDAKEINLSKYVGVDLDQQQLSVETPSVNTVRIGITNGSPVTFNLPTDYTNGGTMNGKITATNIAGAGILNLTPNFTLSGNAGNTVQLNASATTSLNLPISSSFDMLATEKFVNTSLANRSLNKGYIWVGDANNLAAAISTGNAGNILISNGSGLTSLSISGAATMNPSGVVTLTPTTISGYGITDAQTFIPVGTISQYYRGDKSWQTLNKAAVDLANVENIAVSTWIGSENITKLGTIATGEWNAGSISTTGNVTGNIGTFSTLNATNTTFSNLKIGLNSITLNGPFTTGGALTFSGGNAVTFTTTGATNITLPITGTLATTGTTISNTLATGSILVGTSNIATPMAASGNGQILIGNGSTITSQAISGDGTLTSAGLLTISKIDGDPVSLGGSLGIGGPLTFSGAFGVTFTSTGTTNITLPTSGTLATTGTTIPNTLATGSILVGTSNIATALSASGNGQILIGNGTTIASQAISGDATLANNGTFTVSRIGNDAVNLGGDLGTAGALTFLGAYPVTFTSTGPTSVTLPTTGTLATTGSTIPNTLATGSILVGASNIATSLDASGNGQILIGNGTTIVSHSISGDATLANDGNLSLSTTGVSAGTYTSVTVNSKGRVISGTSPTAVSFETVNISSIIKLATIVKPSSPANNGDICFDGSHIFCGIGGVWVQLDSLP